MQANRLPYRHGINWLINGFFLYTRNPALLSMLTFANLLLALLCTLLQPIGPVLLVLASPLIVALIANACVAVAQNSPTQIRRDMLTRGLRENLRILLRLGMVQIAYLMLAGLVIDLLLPNIDPEVLEAMKGGQKNSLDATTMGLLFLNFTLVGMVTLPAFWFAPLLTAWHGLAPLKSVFFSLVAVWRNWRAFLVYVLTVTTFTLLIPALFMALVGMLSGQALGFVTTLVQMLIIMTAAPVLATGAYCSYREIFVETVQENPT